MMEAARRLGVATRFVSGYLYDPALDADEAELAELSGRSTEGEEDNSEQSEATMLAAVPAPTLGAGATHAWMQAYLPGAGWVPFDPTNNLLGGNQLIRVGVARDPEQAAPVSGSWFGDPDAYAGLDVNVQVRRIDDRR